MSSGVGRRPGTGRGFLVILALIIGLGCAFTALDQPAKFCPTVATICVDTVGQRIMWTDGIGTRKANPEAITKQTSGTSHTFGANETHVVVFGGGSAYVYIGIGAGGGSTAAYVVTVDDVTAESLVAWATAYGGQVIRPTVSPSG